MRDQLQQGRLGEDGQMLGIVDTQLLVFFIAVERDEFAHVQPNVWLKITQICWEG